MSISLSLIKKENKEKKFEVNEVIEKYFEALIISHTRTELDGGYVYKDGVGCLSFLIDHKYPNFGVGENFSEKKHVLANKELYEYKIVHKNDDVSRKEVLKILSDWGEVKSDYIFIEQTGMRSSLDGRPPWKTKKGSLFFSVGFIGHYFDKKIQPKIYPNNDQGVKFMEEKLAKNLNKQEIINDFFSQFIDFDGNLQKLKGTGLMHFTTILKEVDGRLKANFVQGNRNIARYFFDPDIVFSSNEPLLRVFRHLYYPGVDIVVKKNLEKMEVSLI